MASLWLTVFSLSVSMTGQYLRLLSLFPPTLNTMLACSMTCLQVLVHMMSCVALSAVQRRWTPCASTDRMRRLSDVTNTLTGLLWCSLKVHARTPKESPQTRTVLSSEPDTTKSPFGAKTRQVMAAVWPSRLVWGSPMLICHTLICPFRDPVTPMLPSLDRATHETGSLCTSTFLAFGCG
uniref:Putative secreted protein n=1 Tax=Ixodes ricinus TaxID=34613 RepID=A0A6B0UZC8_IXORI